MAFDGSEAALVAARVGAEALEVEACERLHDGDRRWRGRGCWAVLAPGDYKLLLVERPEVAAAELAEALRWRIKDLVEFPVAEALIEVFPVGEADSPGNQLYAVAAAATAVDARVEALRTAGLRVRALEIPELALARLGAAATEPDRAVAVLALETSSSLLVVARNGALYLGRHLPAGIEVAAAPAPASDGSGLALDLDPRLEAMTLEIQRTFDHFESHFGCGPVQELLVLGPGDVALAAARLDAALAVATRPLAPERCARWGEAPAFLDPGWGCALGTAMRALEGAP